MNFTSEQIEKAKACKTVEEFKEQAKAEGLNLTDAEAEEYFNATRTGELNDDELDMVAGGKDGGNEIATTWTGEVDCPFCNNHIDFRQDTTKGGSVINTPNACPKCGARVTVVYGGSRGIYFNDGTGPDKRARLYNVDGI